MRSSNRNWLTLGGAGILLASCGGEQANVPPAPRPVLPVSAPAVADEPVKIGEPYNVGGKTYVPADPIHYDEVGYASWYGEEAMGKPTANGEAFVPSAISGAHKTLPLPSYVEVTALNSGRTILVRLNDRGPFSDDKLIDLSRGAAEQLGITGDGAAPVRVRRVNPPEQEKALLRAHHRAPERIETPQPLLKVLQRRLAEAPASQPQQPQAARPVVQALPAASSPSRPGASFDTSTPRIPKPASKTTAPAKPVSAKPVSGGYVVQVAALSSQSRAEALARQIGAHAVAAGPVWRVRYGPYPSQEAAQAGVKAAAAKGFANVRVMANDAR
ncbi:septal ring lytic transglycosylase RlpA family protein [Sphingobium scionense]|uniref:Endolytic peptidoglycan transglycosylase RlpA n=1 Tax=Sphingobium scionense TaxID=1404341 RepID=A0A7W6LVD3_9SPHN|nr:septal ring lytic transglycosylase RlpA family protein [Sphingobium scionense]MBB4150458.1 rare lipoprotein A [Sphingobium scionense]